MTPLYLSDPVNTYLLRGLSPSLMEGTKGAKFADNKPYGASPNDSYSEWLSRAVIRAKGEYWLMAEARHWIDWPRSGQSWPPYVSGIT